jgi:hypothetical protein
MDKQLFSLNPLIVRTFMFWTFYCYTVVLAQKLSDPVSNKLKIKGVFCTILTFGRALEPSSTDLIHMKKVSRSEIGGIDIMARLGQIDHISALSSLRNTFRFSTIDHTAFTTLAALNSP